jgi:hypothetical protein
MSRNPSGSASNTPVPKPVNRRVGAEAHFDVASSVAAAGSGRHVAFAVEVHLPESNR